MGILKMSMQACQCCSSKELREIKLSKYEATSQKTGTWVFLVISVPLIFFFGLGLVFLGCIIFFSFVRKHRYLLCDTCGALHQPYLGGLSRCGYFVNGKAINEVTAASEKQKKADIKNEREDAQNALKFEENIASLLQKHKFMKKGVLSSEEYLAFKTTFVNDFRCKNMVGKADTVLEKMIELKEKEILNQEDLLVIKKSFILKCN
jgi:hypothetical protein